MDNARVILRMMIASEWSVMGSFERIVMAEFFMDLNSKWVKLTR
jgi:hypothetical protein